MKIRFFISTMLLTLLATAPLSANEIYKWTDAQGNVHFGDRPNGDNSQLMAINSRSTDRAAVQNQNVVRAESRAEKAEAKAAAAVEEKTAAEELAAAEELRSERCSKARQQMQKMVTSRRIYREDEAGERTYLDEVEMQAARNKVESQITEYCN